MAIEFDPNLIIENKIGDYDVTFYSADNEKFRLYGTKRDGETYKRIPQAIASTISRGIGGSCASTSGGRIRFVTDSPFVAVKIHYGALRPNDVTPSSGSMAINMYVDGVFGGVFRLPDGFAELDFSSVVQIRGEGEHLITLYLPTHSFISELYVGVKTDTEIKRAPDHTHEHQVVFYGSSITQGTGCSRSGMTYPAQVSRMLDLNFYNLGFGGLAKGEPAMAEYIAGLDMKAFVYDYDYNASLELLDQTHEPFFKIIREKQPNLPIIMISRPSAFRAGEEETAARFAVIKRTYDNAVANGDKNVYLINGLEFFKEYGCECMVDGTHPSDFGYHLMAKAIAPVIKALL